ncbi:copper chaperone CCS1 [Ascoidea rubescens DSM 1968]|uniref:Superoxide dismutase 1 copper chaperone n=1 Tax=Ascoidea rubescens DSM 1968 TaxID=1344418 RepID=A0A1D2V932_9ASCO|nr:Cu,Zn superoxide dismutase-like protein [Ascoidea rubescens DSM 1968]ODV58171.1 Cu,Zn superoxide dismutase-like protein [Ascoidea rubescens DSM 1968]
MASEDFETVYAVPLYCDRCCVSVKNELTVLAGVSEVTTDISNQLVSVVGSEAPSSIIKAIQKLGKDAIIRGTGKPNSAAVCILESFIKNNDQIVISHEHELDDKDSIKGLIRMVATSSDSVLLDVSLSRLPRGTYYSSIRATGNISNGPLSTGAIYKRLPSISIKNDFEEFQDYFKIHGVGIMDLIGRSILITDKDTNDSSKVDLSNKTIYGVIARSAGVWENNKQVCNCTGKTVWQERKDAIHKGLKI